MVTRAVFKWGWIPFILYLGKAEAAGRPRAEPTRVVQTTPPHVPMFLFCICPGISKGGTDPGLPEPSLFRSVIDVPYFCLRLVGQKKPDSPVVGVVRGWPMIMRLQLSSTVHLHDNFQAQALMSV